MNSQKYLTLLSVLLTVKATLMVCFVTISVIGLGPDEAQYWTWSQQLDWGYYSKPPGIAWQIWLGTKFFGQTELGVRFMSIVIGSIIPFAVYFLARCCRLAKKTAFWAGLTMALTPLGILSTFLATTDGGMVLFWTLGCCVIASSLAKGITPNYPLLGLAIACGALFKWPIYLLWVFIFLAWIAFPVIRSSKVILGIAISLLGLIPSLYWNISHDWATFQHVSSTIQGGHREVTSLFRGNVLDFIGAQFALVSPILFAVMIAALWLVVRHPLQVWPSVGFCGGVTALILIIYTTLAIFQKIQGNWAIFAYPTGMVVLAWYGCERMSRGELWLKIGTVISVALTGVMLTVPLPHHVSPFKQNLGWTSLEDVLFKAGYQPGDHFLFSDKYQTTSQISFYGPGQKQAYFLNLNGARKNQFSYWPGMEQEQIGNNGVYLLIENAPHLKKVTPEKLQTIKDELARYFDQVDYRGDYDMVGPSKKAFIFFCQGYNGKLPEVIEKY